LLSEKWGDRHAVVKTRQDEAIARLKTLYAKRGENQIFARTLVQLPADLKNRIEQRAEQMSGDQFPAAEQLFPLWEEYLSFYDRLEDDWVPAIYPRQYDQGIYGTLFGARMHVNRAGTPGWFSSTSAPLEDKTYAELLEMAAKPNREWLGRMESDLRYLSVGARGRWGVAVPITIDGFNLCMQIRGNQTMIDIYDSPEDLKRFLQAGVKLNIDLVEQQHAALGVTGHAGVCDFFNGGWMPDRSVPMSVDCYNMCNPEVYAEFGRPYHQQLIDHFGGGNFHIHGNGRHLLPEVAKLKGCVVAEIANDGNPVSAMADLERVKSQAGPITPVITCPTTEFVRKLQDRALLGGVYYMVGPFESVAAANRLMESVRSYRV